MRPRILLPLALALLATACSGSAAQPTATSAATSTTVAAPAPTAAPTTVPAPTTLPPTTTTVPPTTTTLPPPPSSPLNGLPAVDPALLDRRVLAVKIDNHERARPQSGLQEADAIFEIRVEGGLTRFIALFHDNDSEYLGPVRSARPTDANVLAPLDATFAMSGGQIWIRRYISNRGVGLIGEGTGMFRVGGRPAPHNLYSSTLGLRGAADGRGFPDVPPDRLFDLGEFTGTESAGEVDLPFSDGTRITWRWDGDGWRRYHNGGKHEWTDGQGGRGHVEVDVLVVLQGAFFTAYDPAGQGNAVPATETVGRGKASVFADGAVATGFWDRASVNDPWVLTTEDGAPLAVPAGVPWISVFPSQRDVTWEPYQPPPGQPGAVR